MTSARETYFALAHLMAPPSPALIAVGGLSGTGKSMLARALAPALPPLPGAVVLRSDVERKTLFGARETERLPETAYAPMQPPKSMQACSKRPGASPPPGIRPSSMAVFALPGERAAIEKAAEMPNFRAFS